MARRLPLVTVIAFGVAAVVLASVFYLAGTEGDPEGFGAASAVAMPLFGGGDPEPAALDVRLGEKALRFGAELPNDAYGVFVFHGVFLS